MSLDKRLENLKLGKELAKREEKERKKQEQFMKSMITREEALKLVKGQVMDNMAGFFDAIQDTLKANMIMQYAIADLLIDKGIISNRDDLKEYVERVINQTQEGAADGEREEGITEREAKEPEAVE